MPVKVETSGANWIIINGSGFYLELEVSKDVWDALWKLEQEKKEKE